MVEIEIEPEEREAGRMPDDKIAAAVGAMEEDGVVALLGAVAPENIDRLGRRMLEDLARFEDDGEIANNFQGLRPPPFAPFLFADIVFNEPAIAVSRRVLGEQATLTTYGANTAFVGAAVQQVHADSVPAKAGPPGPCTALVVNVPLVDITLKNGATVYWPGTHRDTRLHSGDRFPSDEMLACWARPSERVLTQRGDLVLRDLGVWHGGMPNTSAQHRPMLALVHSANKPAQGVFEAEEGSEDFWKHPRLGAAPFFSPKPVEYLVQGHSRPKKG